MKKKDAERIVDVAALPPLSAADQKMLESLRYISDEEVDGSDIARLPDSFWQSAVSNPFHRPVKTSTTIRIDADVLAWFKSQGKGYGSRMNAALRRAMLDSAKQR